MSLLETLHVSLQRPGQKFLGRPAALCRKCLGTPATPPEIRSGKYFWCNSAGGLECAQCSPMPQNYSGVKLVAERGVWCDYDNLDGGDGIAAPNPSTPVVGGGTGELGQAEPLLLSQRVLPNGTCGALEYWPRLYLGKWCANPTELADAKLIASLTGEDPGQWWESGVLASPHTDDDLRREGKLPKTLPFGDVVCEAYR